MSKRYQRCQSPTLSGSFEARALDVLGIDFQIDTTPNAGIPESGPLIVAANHPTGIADGLVLMEAVRGTRRDVRIVANYLLAGIPELRDACFFVDPFGGKEAIGRNVAGLRAARNWLRLGGCLLLFPAGEVAWRRWSDRLRQAPDDSEWQPTLARLALATHAQVMPVFLGGRNSSLFYAAGTLHPRLRTLLLGRELLRQRGATISIRFGSTVAFDHLRTLSTPADVTRFVRGAVDALASSPVRRLSSISPQRVAEQLAREVASLPPQVKLLTSGSYDVFCAGSALIPKVLDEIGRLREVTFRAAGEGTGQARDIDRFDASYQHLFVWERTRSEIVGAYRIGATDQILPKSGVEGLYTSTLFKYDERLLDQIAPALELGRSFVRPEYQRSHSALMLLWKGIGELVTRSPQYRVLFGAVSISNRYGDTSRSILRAFLSQHHQSELASLVGGLKPPPPIVTHVPVVTAVDELDNLIRSVEGTMGVPVLLRQYLRLNAKWLGFHIDRSFGDTLDALMMVDLATLPAARLRQYLGRDNAGVFLGYHADRRTTPQQAA